MNRDTWDKLDRLVDEACAYNRQRAKEGKHNYGICCLCGKTHYVETESSSKTLR